MSSASSGATALVARSPEPGGHLLIDKEQRARLEQAKLVALARRDAVAPTDTAISGPYPDGATLIDGDRGWVLTDTPTPRSAGPAAVWAVRREVRRLRMIVGGDGQDADLELAGALARRLSYLRLDSSFAAIVGTDLVDVPPARVATAVSPRGEVPPAVAGLVALMADAGVEVVVEHGVVRGEVLGLEVARIDIDDHATATLAVGVGRFDREITAMLHEGIADSAALVRAAAIVAEHRHRGAPPHPLATMGRARWLRAAVIADPATVGARSLVAVETTEEPPNLRDPWPAAALGVRTDGSEVVVVCTAGVDLDAVTLAADTRALHAPDATLVMVRPDGDRFAPLDDLAGMLDGAVEWCDIAPPWN